MTEEWQEEFWKAMEQYFSSITGDIILDKEQDGYILRSLFSTVKEGKGIALFEAQLYPLLDNVLHLEIYVTPHFNIQEGRIGEMEDAVMNLNYYLPMGTLGIYYPSNQLYLRYMIMIDQNREIRELVAEIGKVYEMLGVTLGNLYEALERVGRGETGYAEEAGKRNLLRQE